MSIVTRGLRAQGFPSMRLVIGLPDPPAGMDDTTVSVSPGCRLTATVPAIDRVLPDGRRLLIWGEVYYVYGPSRATAATAGGDTAGAAAAAFATRSLPEAVRQVEGMYVGALVDPVRGVTVFGDPLTRADVFYAATAGGLVLSLSLPDVLSISGARGYSAPAMSVLMTVYGYYAPRRHTMYEGVRRLGVGESLRTDGTSWTVEHAEFTPAPAAAYGPRELDEYADLFLDAVDTRATDDNWVFLSSGWDSTAILGALVKLRGARRVRAVIGRMDYSTRVDGINKFEIERAQRVADYYGVPLDVVSLNLREPEAIDIWDEIAPTFRDNLNYALAGFNQVRLARHIAARSTSAAVFTGEHSDGLHNFGFSQYATLFHRDLRFREYADKMGSYLFGPTFLRGVEAATHTTDEVYRFFRMLTPDAVFRDGAVDADERRRRFLLPFFIGTRRMPFSDTTHPALTADGNALRESFVTSEYLDSCIRELSPDTLYSWLLHLYPSFHWQGSTARMATVALNMHGLSIKMPFGDARLVEFCGTMPEHWGRGLDLNPTKYPLKWTLANRIDYPTHLQTGPHSYLYDVDPSFSHAAEVLYGSAVLPRFQEVLRSRAYRDLLDPAYFDLPYLDGLVTDFLAGEERRGQALSDLFTMASLGLIGWH